MRRAGNDQEGGGLGDLHFNREKRASNQSEKKKEKSGGEPLLQNFDLEEVGVNESRERLGKTTLVKKNKSGGGSE